MKDKSFMTSCADLTRASRLGTHYAFLGAMAGISPAMTN